MNKREGRKTLTRYGWGLILLVLSPMMMSIENLAPLGWIFLFIAILLFFPEIKILARWIGIKIKRKRHRAVLPEKLRDVLTEIDHFRPSKNWSSEEGYQGELQGHLKNKFPTSRVEVQTGASRPDIIINNIAIEVKGPTDDNAINSLPAKCIKYTKQYDYLIIVLFRPSFSHRNYDAIMEGIKKLHVNVEVVIK